MMRALIADDDRTTRVMLGRTLERWGFAVQPVEDGVAAWDFLLGPAPPSIVLVDWMMPGIDGPSLCRQIRSEPAIAHTYVMLLTARSDRGDLIAGLDAGADDFVTKPFDVDELRARLHVGRRVVSLQQRLADRVTELQRAISNIKQLRGLVPICCYCKRIRSDENYWQQVETYIADHSEAQFSHGICPHCYDKVAEEFARG